MFNITVSKFLVSQSLDTQGSNLASISVLDQRYTLPELVYLGVVLGLEHLHARVATKSCGLSDLPPANIKNFLELINSFSYN